MLQVASKAEFCVPRAWRLLSLALFFSALVDTDSFQASPVADGRKASALTVGSPIERSIVGDQKHFYRVEVEAEGSWLVAAQQQGIDLELTISRSTDPPLITVNNPLGRHGREALVVELNTAGEFQIEVKPAAQFVPAGRYRIEVTPLPDSNLQERMWLEAERAMSEAARLSGEATGESQQKALEIYLATRDLWRELGQVHREAESLHAAAALSAYLGNSTAAVDRYREVIPLWRSARHRRLEARALNDLGFNSRNVGRIDEATEFFEKSIALCQEIGDRRGEGVARSNLCSQLMASGEHSEALDCFREVLMLFEEAGEKKSEALALNSIGGMHFTLGDPSPALANIERAHQILIEIDDRRGQAQMLNNLAFLLRNFGESQTAIDHYRKSAEILQEIGDRRLLARAINNIGFTYLSLGEPQRARAFLLESLALRRQASDKKGEGITLNNLGIAALALRNREEALAYHRGALALLREAGDRMATGNTLALLARANLTLGKPEQALPLIEEGIEIAQDLGDARNEAEAQLLKGQTELALDEPLLAMSSLEQARRRFESFDNQDGQATALAGMANAQRRLGKPSTALASVQKSLEIIESLRIQVDSPHLRATFLASVRDAYELLVELLMEMHRAEPGGAFAQRALEASERAKARSLLDVVGSARGLSEERIDQALLDRRRVLRRELHAAAGRQHRLLQRPLSEERASRLQQDVQAAVSNLEAVDAAIRRQSPSYAALTRPEPISLAEIQEHLGDDTLLLEYSLGSRRSYLWVVSKSSVAVHELPARRQIEDLARLAHGQLSTASNADADEASATLAALSRILLEPAAIALDEQRLAIVADGALHYLPFAALPDPTSNRDPLLLRHEIVYLPSFSVLNALRKRPVPAREGPPSIAVLADPVFDRHDRRVRRPGESPNRDEPIADSALDRAEGRLRSSHFERLPATRLEAKAITSLLPAGSVHQLLDFDASRSAFFDQSLHGYQILHIATHGIVDAQNPELSALVLSLVNDWGLPRQGYLRPQDLYGLELDADLVVLSGCQTALGREVRGEGLLGLTRGFMYSGVPQVVASLWLVEDRATAKMMEGFYSAVLSEKQRPAAALRSAQLSLLENAQTRRPFYWSSFVLQGILR